MCVVTAATAGCGALYFVVLGANRVGPGGVGGTPLGLTFGIAAAAIFLFLAALGMRRKSLGRLARATTWMRAHIWLSILTIPLILLHGGFHIGGPMTQALVGLYALVMLSGFAGLALQHVLPRLMKNRLPVDVVFAQIPHVIRQHFESLLILREFLSGEKGTGSLYQRTLAEETLALEALIQSGTGGLSETGAAVDELLGLRGDSAEWEAIREDWQAVDRRDAGALHDFLSQQLLPRLGEGSRGASEVRELVRVLEIHLSVAVLGRLLDNEVLPYFADREVAAHYYPALPAQRHELERNAQLEEQLAAEGGSEAMLTFLRKMAIPYLSGTSRTALASEASAEKAFAELRRKVPEHEAEIVRLERRAARLRSRDAEARRHHARQGAARKRLGDPAAADMLFRGLKAKVSPALAGEVARIEARVDERRMLDEQTRLQMRLHGWLLFHIPASFALLLLTAWHVVVTLFRY